MIEIKEQVVDSEDVCEAVLDKVFGENAIHSIDMYNLYCTLIEETLMHLKGEN